MNDELIYRRKRVNRTNIIIGNNRTGRNGCLRCDSCRKQHRKVTDVDDLGTNLISAYSDHKICRASFALQRNSHVSNDGGKSGNLDLFQRDRFPLPSKLPSRRKTYCFYHSDIRIPSTVETTLVCSTPSGTLKCLLCSSES